MTHPRVSVFMPVYNGQRYLQEAIESVLQQTYPHFEFLILNDGSIDASQAMIRSYTDVRIRYIENPTPSGLMHVRNQGLKAAKSEYIATIDCDDVWHPQRLEKQVEFMDTYPTFAFVGSRTAFIDEKGAIKGIAWRYRLSPQEIPPFLLFGNYFIHSSILMRRAMIPEGGYQATTAEDYELWVRMSQLGYIWSLPDVLVKYRVHTGSDTYRQAILSNRTQQQIQKIYIAQLKRLAIEPTEKELNIHCAIHAKKLTSINQLQQSAQWLFKIIKANKKVNVYEEKSLLKIVIEKWLIICFSSTKLGIFHVVSIYFCLNVSKNLLLVSPFRCFFSFFRYLKNKDLGKMSGC